MAVLLLASCGSFGEGFLAGIGNMGGYSYGGNSYMEKVKEKAEKEFFRQEWNTQQIFTLWANMYKMEGAI